MSIKGILILLFLTTFLPGLEAQEVDSVKVQKLLMLESTIDSLLQKMRDMDKELQTLKAQIAEGNHLDKLLTAFNEEDVESAPENQRSRRKRVDALLKAITERPGQLRFNGGTTTTVQGNVGENDRFATGVASFDFFAHTSFGSNTLLFIDLEAIGGNGPNEQIQTFTSLNGDAGSTQGRDGLDRLTVLEAWAEFAAFNETLKITAGKIDLTNYFDNNASANDETSQFISGAFVNSAALPVPGNSPGIRLRTTLLDLFFLQLGMASVDNSGSDLFDDLFKIGSVGFQLFQNSDWEANFRFYSYLHSAAGDAAGYGVSFDEAIAGSFNIFARFTENESVLAEWFGISSAWSFGARFVRNIVGRRIAVGVAYGKTLPHAGNLKNEKLLEIYLRQQLNKWVYLSPHFQVVWNAAGSSQKQTLFGFRSHFNF